MITQTIKPEPELKSKSLLIIHDELEDEFEDSYFDDEPCRKPKGKNLRKMRIHDER